MGLVLATTVRSLLRMPLSCILIPVFSLSYSVIQPPDNVRPKRQRMVTQVLGSLSPKWKIQIKFLDLGFSLSKCWLLQIFGE